MDNEIRCANALFIYQNQILLTRENELSRYYLPGGKIQPNESLEVALQRELKEELSLDYTVKREQYLFTYSGPAENQPGKIVSLNCFFLPVPEQLKIGAEIFDYRWLDFDDPMVAPVVRAALDEHKRVLYGKY